METKEICFKSVSGLEARAAAMLIQKISDFKSSIWIEKAERKANAKSLLGLLSLGISCNEQILISAEGEDEAIAVGALGEFIKKL